MNEPLSNIAMKACTLAQDLCVGTVERSTSQITSLLIDLNRYAKGSKDATPQERELHFATGFLLQACERLSHYLAEDDLRRIWRWRRAVADFIDIVREAGKPSEHAA